MRKVPEKAVTLTSKKELKNICRCVIVTHSICPLHIYTLLLFESFLDYSTWQAPIILCM